MDITSSSGWGLKIRTLFFVGCDLSGLYLSSTFGLPPGHPVMVLSILLKTSRLISYADCEIKSSDKLFSL